MLADFFDKNGFLTALAPMQDITDAGFFARIAECGAPDFFVSEFLRVTPTSKLDPKILNAVLSKPAGKDVAAQIIGCSIPDIERIVNDYAKYPQIDCLDLNAGCPAPKVYKKNVGGSLLKEPREIAEILRCMRKNWSKTLSLKMRIGFENDKNFYEILRVAEGEGVDFITIHARTVKQLYRGVADHSYTKKAVEFLKIPVIANGDITSAQKAIEVLSYTNARGVMVGRSSVRNPWIFRQISEALCGREIYKPTLGDVLRYVYGLLNDNLKTCRECKLSGRMKKFLNFVAVGVDKDGNFLNEMRKACSTDELMKVCEKHLGGENSEKLFAFEPYPGLCSRPNHES